jgi:flagellar motor protein MotB
MSEHRNLLLVVSFLVIAASAGIGQVNTLKPGDAVEHHLSSNQTLRQWSRDSNPAEDVKIVKVCRVAALCKMRYTDGRTPRMRVRNLVMPLRREDENTPIPESFTRQIREALDNLQDKHAVTVRFIGYTDDAPLTGADQSTFGNQLALSKARAQRVALAMQKTLGLPTSAIESEGRGASRPVASNETVQGRALNRRIEVEFWYDDPLQELSEEPQLCPDDIEETVTRVYDPLWGSIPNLELANGQPIIPPGYAANLHRALADIAGRTNARLRFIGYTRDERLDRRTASVYGDDIGLSAARARRAMDVVMQDPTLSGARSEHEGRGYVQSDDVVNTGFTDGQDSFVRVQVVYDEPLPLDNYDGVEITHVNQELNPKSPYELNTMHITVDGKPIDDPGRSSSDIQRCTDVALDSAKIEFHFDNLESRRRLAVAAHPAAVSVSENADDPEAIVRFRMYNNYAAFIQRAEIRIFDQSQSLEAAPLKIIAVNDAGLAEWQPGEETLAGPTRELKYVLRAYDSKGNFDETDARPLLLNRGPSRRAVAPSDQSPRELLAAYGENDLAKQHIPLGSGTVKVQGSGMPAGHTVWLAGHPVPVDPQGKFVAEEILPNGTQTVEVAVVDDAGNGSLYLRDLDFKRKDLFYFAVADLTVSKDSTSGPAAQLEGQNNPLPYDSSLNGRFAFFVNGKVSENWRVTASADSREGPVKDIFSNFLDKSPDELFRRIDPAYFYPSYGDDGVVEQMAPTMGKFFVKASREADYAMWGNFKVGYLDNELAHIDRGLYGANLHYETEQSTSFGERRIKMDTFAAQPGTVPAYEQFLGTGGSLYFLHHQDILTGSEQVRIEIRDKASTIVTGVVNLQPNVDYDIDYLQGRVMLTQPLSSTASDNLLVRNSGLSGNLAYLVVQYEYTPGFDQVSEVSVGGQGHLWVNDYVRVGLTADSNSGDDVSNLGAADLTLRKSNDSWIKVQTGRSTGLVSESLVSNDGGFAFSGPGNSTPGNSTAGNSTFTGGKADAYRADLSVGLNDFFDARGGRFTLYTQSLDAGYSAPGEAAFKNTQQYGGTFKIPVTSSLSFTAKGDQKTEDQGLKTRALELDVVYKLAERWSLSTGVRDDLRKDNSPLVPLTQEQGERIDTVEQVKFDANSVWSAYGFVQQTVEGNGNLGDNSRGGVGGSYRLSKRLKIDGEVSDGDLGPGAKIGTSYLYSDQTSMYLNYTLQNELTDNNGEFISRGSEGSLVSGMKKRLSDSSSVYVEERYQNGGLMNGLTHSTGVNLVPKEHWNVGASTEFGKLRDVQTGADTNRKAAAIHMGYGSNKIAFSSAVEYRRDNAEQPDLTHTLMSMWLFRNNGKIQLTPDWRLIGKLDYSISNSSQGQFLAGGYTQGIIGYGYRPVRNDRLNVLAKYTYFYNVPTPDQLGLQNTVAEFLQKSHIASFDVTYDLTPNWSIGSKYAYRLGEESLDRTTQNFFNNPAQLAVLRLDLRFFKQWEGMAEVRTLDLPDLNQMRRGAMTAIYHRLGKDVKAGVGYNFTDFSDDLTDLKYNHRGVFFNVIATK